MQGKQRRSLLADQQDSRSLAVKTMREFQKARLRPLPTQGFDDPEALAAAAVHRDAGRLVDDQQTVILVKDRQVHVELGAGDDLLLTPGDAQRRNAQHIASLQTIRDFRTPTIHAHLAAAHDAVNVAFGHALALLEQQIVEPLPMLVLGNQCLSYRAFANFRHFEYTSIDLRLVLKEALTR